MEQVLSMPQNECCVTVVCGCEASVDELEQRKNKLFFLCFFCFWSEQYTQSAGLTVALQAFHG